MNTYRPLFLQRLSAAALAVTLLSGAAAHADTIATDAGVPAIMDSGGTAGNPDTYILGQASNYTRAFSGNSIIGENTSYNELIVQNGAAITSEPFTMAWRDTSHYNSLILKGGSIWDASGNYIVIGSYGHDNTVTISEGSKMMGGTLFLNRTGSESYNNQLTISGNGSEMTLTSAVYVGSSFVGSNAVLTLENSGLLRVDNNAIWAFSVGEGSTVRFDGGYIAWLGEVTYNRLQTAADNGLIQAWNGESWQTSSAADVRWKYYATDEEGLLETGIDGLGGYTVLTAVPEPGTWALLGAGLLGLALRRRFQTRS